ncbi:MAG: hypothetical protein H7234_05565 [Herminiimonas sp.]|nr:hypothetical protein [Herminiimonas sp.]
MTITASPLLCAVPADVPLLSRLAPPVAISRIAVLFQVEPGATAHPWDATRVREQVAVLMTDAQLTFDYYPVHFAGSGAAAGIAAVFARIAAAPAAIAPELVLVVGGPAVNADIAVIHQVLAPCILAAAVPVFTALGADDAETILGDTACSVFPGVHAMLEAVTAIAHAGRAPVDTLQRRIQSLGRFLLAQQEAESRIMMQAMLVPALHKQMDDQMQQTMQASDQAHAAAQRVRLRLMREEAMLEQVRARIGIELARLAQQQASVALDAAGLLRLRHVRIGMLCGFLCLVAILWWSTTPASTMFFSGCAAVMGSALYVAISNRIIDGSTATMARRDVTVAAAPGQETFFQSAAADQRKPTTEVRHE